MPAWQFVYIFSLVYFCSPPENQGTFLHLITVGLLSIVGPHKEYLQGLYACMTENYISSPRS